MSLARPELDEAGMVTFVDVVRVNAEAALPDRPVNPAHVYTILFGPE